MIEPYYVDMHAFTVVGPQTRTTNADEARPTTARIPSLWGAYLRSPGPTTYAVYGNYESDHTGAYDITVGTPPSISVPKDWVRVEVPPGRYLVFANEGAIPAAVIAAWQQVWQYFDSQADVQRAFTTDFERYDPARPGRVEIHIAIR